jgi:hypothetical protein
MTGNAAAAPAATLALQPRSVPQLFDAMFGIVRHHAWDLFVLSLLFHLPVHAFRIAADFAGPRSVLRGWFPEPRLGMLWWLVWNSLAVTACAVATCQIARDGDTSVRRVFAEMRRGGWRLVGTVAAFEVLVDGCFVLASEGPSLFSLAIPFVALLAWCAPAIPAAVMERLSPWSAVRRALWLVRHNFWRVAMAVWIVWLVTSLLDDGIVQMVRSLSDRAAVAGVSDLVVDGALYPLRGVVLALVYLDCRVRREGYDVERLMQLA